MPRLLEFLANHSLLGMIFFALLGMFLWTFLGASGGRRVDPGQATRLINHDNAVVIDVRSDGEYEEGHIINAVHVPLSAISRQLDKLERYRTRPIITTCGTGQKAANASGMLRKHGFEKVYSLNGGIAAWQGASLPLTQK